MKEMKNKMTIGFSYTILMTTEVDEDLTYDEMYKIGKEWAEENDFYELVNDLEMEILK